MIFNDIKIPQIVIDALENDNLVIFTGAGTSKAPPSSLTNFRELCDQIGLDFGEEKLTTIHNKSKELVTKKVQELKYDIDEDFDVKKYQVLDILNSYIDTSTSIPEDQYLGMIEHQLEHGTIRNKVRSILNPPDIECNDLHRNIVNLFKSHDKVKIVTTNYDVLLRKAAEEVFEELPTQYFAPALPVGSDFEGIVYLHGGFDANRDKSLVLTDGDFGKAYLTNGWASTFVRELFSKYVVLFIGYSHNDLIMQYVSRGLSYELEDNIYTLTDTEADGRWSRFHITPIIYDQGQHNKMKDALGEWAAHRKNGLMGQAKRLLRIMSVNNLTDREIEVNESDEHFLKEIFIKSPLRATFNAHCKNKWWVKWLLENDEILLNLIQKNKSHDQIENDFNYCIARLLVSEDPQWGLLLLSPYKKIINKDFAFNVLKAICWSDKEPIFNSQILLNWLLLIEHSGIFYDRHRCIPFFHSLLKRCEFNSYKQVYDFIFNTAFTPTNIISRSYSDSSEIFETTKLLEKEFLKMIWDEFYLPHIESIAFNTCNKITSIINKIEQYSVLETEDSSWISSTRDSIEIDHSSLNNFGSWNLLFDIIIDSCNVLMCKREQVSALIQIWIETDSEILNRLSLYLMRKSNTSIEEKIQFLLKYTSKFQSKAFPEYYDYIQDLCNSNNSRLIEVQNKVINEEFFLSDKDCEAEIIIYRKIMILSIFLKSNPENNPINEFIDKSFKIHPELKHYTYDQYPYDYFEEATIRTESSPISQTEILQKTQSEILEYLNQMPEDNKLSLNSPKRNLLAEITQIAKFDPEWAIEFLFDTSLNIHLSNTELVKHLFEGLAQTTDLTKDIFIKLISNIMVKDYRVASLNISQILHKNYDKHLKDFCANDLVIIKRLTNEYIDLILMQEMQDIRQPLSFIINITSVFLNSCRDSGKTGKVFSILENDKAYLIKMIKHPDLQELLFRNLSFLFRLDSAWIIDNMISLLSWKNEDISVKAWSGFLSGSISRDIYLNIQKYLSITIKHLNKLAEYHSSTIDNFMKRILVILEYFQVNSINEEWMKVLLSSDYSIDFVKNLCTAIRYDYDDFRVSQIWKLYLKSLLEHSTSNRPKPLTPAESGLYFLMFPFMGSCSLEYLQAIKQIKIKPEFEAQNFFHLCYKILKDLVEECPQTIVTYFNTLFKVGIPDDLPHSDIQRIYNKLNTDTVHEEDLSQLKEHLLTIGCVI